MVAAAKEIGLRLTLQRLQDQRLVLLGLQKNMEAKSVVDMEAEIDPVQLVTRPGVDS